MCLWFLRLELLPFISLKREEIDPWVGTVGRLVEGLAMAGPIFITFSVSFFPSLSFSHSLAFPNELYPLFPLSLPA